MESIMGENGYKMFVGVSPLLCIILIVFIVYVYMYVYSPLKSRSVVVDSAYDKVRILLQRSGCNTLNDDYIQCVNDFEQGNLGKTFSLSDAVSVVMRDCLDSLDIYTQQPSTPYTHSEPPPPPLTQDSQPPHQFLPPPIVGKRPPSQDPPMLQPLPTASTATATTSPLELPGPPPGPVKYPGMTMTPEERQKYFN